MHAAEKGWQQIAQYLLAGGASTTAVSTVRTLRVACTVHIFDAPCLLELMAVGTECARVGVAKRE